MSIGMFIVSFRSEMNIPIDMFLTIGQLRRLINEHTFPEGDTIYNREQLTANSIKNMYHDELAPHLQDVEIRDDEDDDGPVPRKNDNDFYTVLDPYAEDWLPTPSVRFER